jgi:hypothetical protein
VGASPWLSIALAALSACGRLGFDALGGGSNGHGDGGSATGDGGATSDGSPTGDGAVNECPSFATFCDGFETGDTSRWTRTTVDTGGTLDVQTTTVHSGNYALSTAMASGAMAGNDTVVDLTFAEQTTGMLAVRAWIYQPVELDNYACVIELYNTLDGGYVLVGGDPTGDWDVGENSSAGLHNFTSSTTVAQDQWLCVELDYTFVAGSPAIEVFVDDVSIVDVVGYNPSPGFDLASLGVARTDGPATATFVDDVAFAQQHLGCP